MFDMETQERIKKLGKYFAEMNILRDNDDFIMYILVHFPAKWTIMRETIEKFGVSITPNDDNTGYYFWATSSNEEQIFDAIDMNIKVNEDAEAKVKLLNEKIAELKDLFCNDDIELSTLQTLEFKFTKKPKEIKKIKENIEESATQKETVSENVPLSKETIEIKEAAE